MPWLIVIGLVLGGLYLYNQQQKAPPQPGPQPGPAPGPLPPAPQPTPPPVPPPVPPPAPPVPSTVPTTTDSMGNTVVTVAPGNLGTLSMQSAATAAAASAASGTALTPSGLVVAAPSGGGITTVGSTNMAVLAGNLLDPANLGQPVPSVTLGPPLVPGTATVNVSWNDATGAQSSSFSLTAT
jgi:hypothetical protein